MEILADIDELDRSRPIQHDRRGVRNPYLDAFGVLLQDSQLLNQSALRIGQEENPTRQTQFVDEDPGSLVDLCVRHHPDDFEVWCLIECFPQLNEPRLGIGSPIHAAFERQQDSMAQQILTGDGSTFEIDEFEFRQWLTN